MSDRQSVSRRTFIASATAAATVTQWTAKSYASILGANDRIRIGFIGAGGMGTNHLNAIRQLTEKNNLQPVAVADCWTTRAADGRSASERNNRFKTFAASWTSRTSITSPSPHPSIGTAI